MSILGIVVRTRPADLAQVATRLAALPGAELAPDVGDGRLALVLEDLPAATDPGCPAVAGAPTAPRTAAQCLADIAQWPEVLGASLVWEYCGPDAPEPQGQQMPDFRAWRGRPGG